jgi:hypothetical protein
MVPGYRKKFYDKAIPIISVRLGGAMMPHGLQMAFGHVYAILYA